MEYDEIYYRAAKAGYRSMQALAKSSNISYANLINKIKGQREWKRDEIEKVCRNLNITSANDIKSIFFPNL